jgi:hypothetical protein
MARLGIEFDLILKNRLIIRDASTTWRLRTSLQPYSQEDSQGPGKVEDHLFSFSSLFLFSAALGLNEDQGRMDKTTEKRGGKNGHGRNINISVCNDEESHNL